jgi:hypothetical protein
MGGMYLEMTAVAQGQTHSYTIELVTMVSSISIYTSAITPAASIRYLQARASQAGAAASSLAAGKAPHRTKLTNMGRAGSNASLGSARSSKSGT